MFAAICCGMNCSSDRPMPIVAQTSDVGLHLLCIGTVFGSYISCRWMAWFSFCRGEDVTEKDICIACIYATHVLL